MGGGKAGVPCFPSYIESRSKSHMHLMYLFKVGSFKVLAMMKSEAMNLDERLSMWLLI